MLVSSGKSHDPTWVFNIKDEILEFASLAPQKWIEPSISRPKSVHDILLSEQRQNSQHSSKTIVHTHTGSGICWHSAVRCRGGVSRDAATIRSCGLTEKCFPCGVEDFSLDERWYFWVSALSSMERTSSVVAGTQTSVCTAYARLSFADFLSDLLRLGSMNTDMRTIDRNIRVTHTHATLQVNNS